MSGPSPSPIESPNLIWTPDGEPRSGRFDDVYFSRDDGLAESRAVFLGGCDLPDAWAGRSAFCVAELGFGTGLNIAALLETWRAHRPAGGHLNVFSIEAFPLSVDEARRALSHWPELADAAEAILSHWPDATPGFHRMVLPGFDATIDIAIGDVDWALRQWSGKADAWFLDGFSPALNPDMWSEAVFKAIAARSAPDARLATFTVAGAVRRGLAAQGFAVDKRPGHGRKRERLEARMGGAPVKPSSPSRIAIVGAGIAGASLARAFTRQGVEVVVIEAERAGAGASGFPAALVTPRLDAGDATISGFHARALAFATAAYRAVAGAVIADGVLQLEQAPRDAMRFAKISAQTIWSSGAMRILDEGEGRDRLGEPTRTGGLLMKGAVTVQPTAILNDWLGRATRLTADVAMIQWDGDGCQVMDAQNRVVIEADIVVVACGWGADRLLPELGMTPVRGQADWVETSAPVMATAWGGYVAPTPTGFLFGATHSRGETDKSIRPDDSRRNFETLRQRLPERAAWIDAGETQARAAIRATTRDRLPVCGAVPGREGLYVLGGLGSRGFCTAPLLAEHLVARVLGRPSPIPADQADRLSPERSSIQAGLADASR